MPALVGILRHMRAPPCLGRVLASFYHGAQRLFKVGRVTGDKWQMPSRGLLQGCPLSPVCALLIGNIWHSYVTQGPVRALIFVDDRLMWANPEEPQPAAAALAEGVARSNRFDEVMTFTCRPSKCAIVEVAGDQNLSELAKQLCYPTRPRLEILGITLEVQTGATGLINLSVKTLQARLRALNILQASLEVSKAVYSSPVSAALVWAAGVAAPSDKDISSLRSAIHKALRPQITGEAPWLLIAEVYGWQWDPKWLLQWRALCTAWRFQTSTSSPEASEWRALLPHASDTLADFGWRVEQQGAVLSRVDDLGHVRRYSFGWHNISVLREWNTASVLLARRGALSSPTIVGVRSLPLACNCQGLLQVLATLLQVTGF